MLIVTISPDHAEEAAAVAGPWEIETQQGLPPSLAGPAGVGSVGPWFPGQEAMPSTGPGCRQCSINTCPVTEWMCAGGGRDMRHQGLPHQRPQPLAEQKSWAQALSRDPGARQASWRRVLCLCCPVHPLPLAA